ncbi:hypothetical protein [Cellulomonas marina]|uniref:Uncharacterized protein n=1 Tax=Cellulomonas marina TaxID=988821 RepID=A0A1I0V195_9CELL|nr:hypothetical protein [Cellulomonas marina]GIG28241.1 hypothetical protein Cma02nite_08410 [Cellulomonas marina]SFA69827.1 hypothetical protein SAMN05421867_10168 [Cellulomonas marina]
MRWEALFADLEAQAAAEERAEALVAVPDLVRAERASVLLADRLRASRGAPLVVTAGSRTWAGAVLDAASEWLLLAPSEHRRVLVVLAAVRTVRGLGRAAGAPPGRVEGRLGLTAALRGLARDRVRVRVLLRDDADDADGVVGRLDAVYADHVDLLPDEAAGGRRGPVTVSTAAVAAVEELP